MYFPDCFAEGFLSTLVGAKLVPPEARAAPGRLPAETGRTPNGDRTGVSLKVFGAQKYILNIFFEVRSVKSPDVI